MKFLRFLRTWDGVWSIPLAIFLFIGTGYLITWYFGPEAGMMLPVYIQRIFYAIMVMVAINFFCWFSIYLNFPGLFHYYDDQKEDGSFPADFKKMESKLRFKWTVGIYFMYFAFFTLILIFT